jgi:peptide-methionine (S)-S-oxide reductase
MRATASHFRSRGALRFVLTLPLALLFTGVCAAASAPDAPATVAPLAHGERRVVFAGGCFWGVQEVFESLKGVTQTTAGFAGGAAWSAHYETVSTGTTGHAESVQIDYDPRVVSFQQLLTVFFRVAHDPTELDRQGPDSGTQYRSAIFTTGEDQTRLAQAYIRRLDQIHAFPKPIVTTVGTLAGFFPAENYHQHYARLHPEEPYIAYNDAPKLVHLHQEYPALVK